MKLFFRLFNPDYWVNKITEKVFKVKKYDWYELKNNKIVKHSPDESQRINIEEILSWSVTNEMIFDLVEIQMKNGKFIVWEDYYNDLITILSTCVARKN